MHATRMSTVADTPKRFLSEAVTATCALVTLRESAATNTQFFNDNADLKMTKEMSDVERRSCSFETHSFLRAHANHSFDLGHGL